MDESDDVAARLRQKIRLQAEELLMKVDMVKEKRPSSSPGNSSSALDSLATPSSTRASFRLSTSGQKSPNSASHTPKGGEDREDLLSLVKDRNQDTEYQGNDDDENNNSVSSFRTKDELTKRLQLLSMERQKDNQADRLRVIQADPTSHLSSVKTFQELNLPEHLLHAIFAMGFDRPSAIQEEALPRILANPPRDLIAQAQSGSGKTAAFTLGMLFRIKIDTPATTQALCVTPTRELAIQIVEKAIAPMAADMEGLKIQLALSQTFLTDKSGVDAHLVVGTPGKVVDWLKRKFLKTQNMKVFVLDEADVMCSEDGHRANSLVIQKKLPAACQRLLFSATFPPSVVDFCSKSMLKKPDKILLADEPANLILDVIKQLWIDTREYAGTKVEFLADIYSLLTIGQSIVFVGTKDEADLVHETLGNAGYTCSVLHSGVEPDQRDDTMQKFREGQSNVLITTNVLARGVDVDNVCLVVNYSVPVVPGGAPDYETYLHRIGRTGRFGRKGTAITFISDMNDMQALAKIERYFSEQAGEELIQKAPADPEALAEVIQI